MIIKRYIAAAIVFGIGLALASCSDFSGYVADHWPHWAGGMPDDVPPRPGAPGYNEFIAHGQTDQDTTRFAAPGPKTAATNGKTITLPAPTTAVAPAAAVAPADDQPVEDPSVVKGGLY